MNFKFLSGDSNWKKYGGKFISKRLNNGDWDYWPVYEVVNMEEACGEKGYNVSLFAVSPEAASEEKLREAIRSMGLQRDEVATWIETDIGKVTVLSDYGIQAQLWTGNGNNLSNLLKEVHHQANAIAGITFGFIMDAPQNGIGSTGWDLIAGNIMAGLKRYEEAKEKGEKVAYSPAMKIVAKMHGIR